MPYTSDAKRERARYMTIEEAIAFVSQEEGCGREDAEQQLRDAVSDGKLFIRWEDQRQPHGDTEATPIPDRPPTDGDQWRDPDDAWYVWAWQQAPFCGAKVFDPFTQRERTLLLLGFSVEQIWRKRPPAPRPLPAARPPELREKVKKLLLDRNVDLTIPVKEISRHVRDNWNEAKHPSDRTIVRAIKAAKEATAQVAAEDGVQGAGRSRD